MELISTFFLFVNSNMEALTSAVLTVGNELAKVKEENEFLKKKMSEMFTAGQARMAYTFGRHDGRKRKLDTYLIRHTRGIGKNTCDYDDLLRQIKRF